MAVSLGWFLNDEPLLCFLTFSAVGGIGCPLTYTQCWIGRPAAGPGGARPCCSDGPAEATGYECVSSPSLPNPILHVSSESPNRILLERQGSL